MRENLVRICCFLLGVLLTLSGTLVGEQIKVRRASDEVIVTELTEAETVEVVEELTITEEVKLYSDYEAEAEAKLKLLKEEEAAKKAEEESLAAEASANGEVVEDLAIEETVSANSIEAAKVKWKKDYPKINSTMSLEQKMAERSSYEETLAVNAFDKKVIEDSTIDFSDVTITIIGDSLTEGSNLSEEERAKYAYPVILQEILGCKEVINMGIGGSTVSSCSNSYPMVNRWQDAPMSSDIIIVFGGSNDALFENKWDYGHLEYDLRMNEDTFCGDLDKMVGAMKYTYRDTNMDSYIKLLYVNPPSTILNDAVYNTDPGNMVHQSEFAKAINEIVPNYGFEVIDMYNNNILNTHDPDVNAQFMPDGIHGNAEGYRIIAEHIASQIIQRIEQE